MRIKHLVNKSKYIKKDNKSGFTLIEIIVVILLISVVSVSSFVSVRIISNNKEIKKYERFYSQFDDALSLYLALNPEIYENLTNNVEGAIVSLELLKNKGLIADDIKDPTTNDVIDYKNNYYVLSDAVLLKNGENEEDTESLCDGRIEIEVIKSWEVLSDKVETDDIIYVCPKENDETDEEENVNIDALLKRIESLENALSLVNLGGDNWVLFDVETDTSKGTYWPSENQDLWAIVSASGNEMKIIYNNYVNNKDESFSVKYTTPSNPCEVFYNTKSKKWTVDTSKVKYLDLNKNNVYRTSSNEKLIIEYLDTYYVMRKSGNKCYATRSLSSLFFVDTKYGGLTKISNNNGWTRKEIETDKYNTSGSKKKDLYDKVVHNSFIQEKNYYYDYDTVNSNTIEQLNTSLFIKDKFGTVSTDDPVKNIRSMLLGKNFYIGSYYVTVGFSNYNGFALFSNGSLDIESVNDLKDGNKNDFFIHESTKDDILVDGKYGIRVNTVNYIPVFTIKFDSLIQNIDSYPSAYKTKYSKCTSEELGSKDCPYVMKLSDSTYSWNG